MLASPEVDLIWGPGCLEDAIKFIKINHNGEVPDDTGKLWYDDYSFLKIVKRR